ncbi:MAG: hypothetical protein GWO86_01125 [Planctomycetes bacterium]|nr:hypothetical protein [Planctomycetota bacterium]
MTKIAAVILCSVIFIFGCQQSRQNSAYYIPDNTLNDYSAFAPVKIKITGLTEFVDASNLKIYVDLIDGFGSRVKSPAVFRFELYEYVPRSAEPKGRRIFLWPDIDLTTVEVNNAHWRDFLRSYEFDMKVDFELNKKQTYILQALCRTSSGSRLDTTKQLTFRK